MKIISISSAQQRIWLEWTLDSENVAYNNPLMYQLTGALDCSCLEKALQQIVADQPAMRSYFITQAGLPKQVIKSACSLKLDIHDVTNYFGDERQHIIDQIIANNVRKPFDLTQLPLFRFTLIKIDTNDYLFILNIHHIVVDGFSAQLLIQLISRYYKECLTGETISSAKLDGQYCDYIEQSNQNNQDKTNELRFWQSQFTDANIHIDLYQSNVSAQVSEEGVRTHFSISTELTQHIKQLSKRYKTTDFIVLMAAFYVVLSKYTNQDDLTIGYPLDIRPASCRDLFGFFVNNIPFRMSLKPEDTLRTLIERMNQKRKELKAYQKTDLSQIIRYVRMLYPSHPDTLYNVSFIRANFAMTGLELPQVNVVSMPISTGAVKDDLCLLYDENESFEFEIEFNKQRYAQDYIEQIQASYVACLQALCCGEETQLADIHVFNSSQALCRGKITPVTEHLIDRFLNHVKTSPNRAAIITSDQALTYQQLYEAVAAYRDTFVGSLIQNKPVVVCLQRSPQLLAVLLALQWMEITYIPIDPTLSSARIKSIIEDSQASALIHDHIDDTTLQTLPCQLIPLSKAESGASTFPAMSTHNHTAYIIYTSGSTGKPKGVAIGREALSNFLGSMAHYFLQNDNALMLAITTVGFDIAMLELFLPIWQQRTVFIANQEQHKDPFMLLQILNNYPITHLQATPAMWQMLGETGWPGQSSLIALCGGEALPTPLACQLTSKVGELWNMYGPTEATVWCSLKQIKKNDLITVGQPIDNMEMRVLDASQHLLPPYVKGELYIGGIGLADGYLNNKELTQSQFINNESSIGGRLYRAGDVACTTADGEFIIFGRTDNQIKLNGYRIELGEIESRLLAIEGVLESAVIVHQKQLIAFVSMKSHANHFEADLLEHLAQFLPEYMLPKCCFILDKLPLTTSGKIDRKALPLDKFHYREQFENPSNDNESALLSVWQLVLKKDAISVTDNFYSLGGHSLLAVQLTVEVNNQFNTHLKLADILRHPTIRQQSRLLHIPSVENQSNEIPTTKAHIAPLSLSQQRIWFVSKLTIDRGQFNMAALMSVHGALDHHRFRKAMDSLIHRHESLRMMVSIIDHAPYQSCLSTMTVELQSMPSNELSPWVSWAAQPFDLLCAPLWRISLHQINPGECVIGISMHHLIADGYSVPQLLQELWSVYESGQVYPALPSRFIDYALYESKQIESQEDIQFWTHELLECPYLTLPYDAEGSRSGIGTQFISSLKAETWNEVQRFCATSHLSLGCFLMGAFGLLMHHYSRQTDFCIGLPVANREHAATKEMIGCFMDLIPVRMSIVDSFTVLEWLKLLETQLTDCLAHNSLSFSSLLSHLNIERNGTESPLFPVVLNIQSDPFVRSYSSELNVQVKPVHTHTSKYDLSLEIYFADDHCSCQWEFANDLFKIETIKKMSEQFEKVMINLLQGQIQLSAMGVSESTLPILSHQMPLITTETDNYRGPQTALQQKVAAVWKKVLKLQRVGLDDHFFRLGGHSFLAAQVISSLSEQLNMMIPMEFVFRYSKLVDFCEAINHTTPEQIESKSIYTTAIPLTPNQRQIVLSSTEGCGDLHHISVLIEFEEEPHIVQIEDAFNQVLSQHSIYSWYLSNDQNHAQFSSAGIKIDSIQLDSSNDLFDCIHKQNCIPIDLHQAPLLRVTLFGGPKHALLVTIHHIIADEGSLQLLVQAVLERYYTRAAAVSASRWESHLDQWLKPGENAEAYWETYLINPAQSRIIPTRVEGPVADTLASYQHWVQPERIAKCSEFANHCDATFYHAALALFIYLVDMVTLSDEINFAVSFDRRRSEEQQHLHGYLVNLLPLKLLRADILHFSDLIEWVKLNNIAAMEHVDVDYSSLMEKGLVSKPDIVFNFQHTHDITISSGAAVTWRAIGSKRAKFSLVFNLRLANDGALEVLIEYPASLYHAEFIESLAAIYATLLQRMPQQAIVPMCDWFVAKPSVPTGLDANSADDLIARLRKTGIQYSNHHAVHYGEQAISYMTLWRDVERLAQAMLYLTNVEIGGVVAVVLTNKYQYVVTILAVLQVGAVFLGVDTHLPWERQQLLIKDSGAKLVIHDAVSQVANSPVTSSRVRTRALRLYNNQEILRAKSRTQDDVPGTSSRVQRGISNDVHIDDLLQNSDVQVALPTFIKPDTTAYLIYTSGSTGTPKATIIDRRALLHFIEGLQGKLGINYSDHVLQFSSLSFDASIWEIFISLYTGATLFIPDEKERRMGKSLQEFMATHKISHAILTPAVLNTLDPLALPSLRVIASGGEACTPNLIKCWSNECDFYNAYGPTEATVCVALHKCSPGTKASIIGEPLGKAKLWVASPSLSLLPIGAIGELLIGGPILASGYLNQAELTAERFVIIEGERWYRSGDRVRQINAHQFEYLGRLDRQVKLRGLRIELGEIEAVLTSMSGIRSAYCLIDQEQLFAYITSGLVVSARDLMVQLSHLLPSYLLPNQIIQVESIPILPSGKIDLSQLKIPTQQPAEYHPPNTDIEKQLHGLWCKALRLSTIDIEHDFFAIGGNSLQAMGLAAEIEAKFSIEFPMQSFYTHGSIELQSHFIEDQINNKKMDISLEELLSQLTESEREEFIKQIDQS